MKLLWDAIGSEFGARHELYEMNYAGSHELVRLFPLQQAQVSGSLEGDGGARRTAAWPTTTKTAGRTPRICERRGRLGIGTAQVELPARSAICPPMVDRAAFGRVNIGARARKAPGYGRALRTREGNGGGSYVVSDVQMCNRTGSPP